MLAWALRCVCLTLAGGLAFVGFKDSGWMERLIRAPGPTAAPIVGSSAGADQGGYLEEIIPLGSHGHFVADVQINGTPITVLIDTGATHTVLNREDAARLRLSGGQLRYTVPFESANGITYAAPVTLRDVRLGHFQAYDVDAFVNEGDLGISLLGMSFLRKFENYEFQKDRLVLRW